MGLYWGYNKVFEVKKSGIGKPVAKAKKRNGLTIFN